MLRLAAVLAGFLALAACASTSAAPPRSNAAQTYADYLVGRTANLRDDYDAAATRYFAALERAPRNEALIEGALNASLALGDDEGARRAARLAATDEAPAAAHLVRAVDALRASNLGRARQELMHTEGAASEELLARTMLIWASGGGELDGVLLQLTPLSSIRPYGGLFAYQQAMALDLAGRDGEALAAYEIAARSGIVLAAGAQRHAQLLLRANRRDDAVAVLRASLSTNDPSIAAALARVQNGGAAVEQPLTPAKGAAIGVYGMAAIFLQEHDMQSGLLALTLSQMLDPDFDMARMLFAETQADLGRYDIARERLARVASSSPYYSSARVLDAWTLLDAGRNEDALTVARSAADGGDLRARRALADMYARLDRPGEAEPIYTQLIAADGDDWRLYFSRGAARERTDRWPEAEADLQHALDLSPQQPEVLNYLGYSWIDRGEHVQEGMAMIQRAVALRPNSAAILDSLGWGYYKLHNYDQAVLHLERAVELEPADATLNDHLGDVYWRTGRHIEARYQWQRALTLSPEDPAALQAKVDHGLPPLPRVRPARRR